MKSNEGLISCINEYEEVKRIKALENYIKTNEKINELFSLAKLKQKQMVNAREYHQAKQYEVYVNEYNELIDKLFDLPFVEEYLELVDTVNEEINNCYKIIENVISNKLNEK